VRRAGWWRRGFFASQTAFVLLALAGLITLMALQSSAFLSGGNLSNVAKNFSYVAIVGLGVTLVIITGGIDLSVGSVMALSAILTAMTMQATGAIGIPGLSLVLSLLAGLGSAALAGLINGVLIARVGLSPFVTTLGMLSVVRGLAYAITEGRGQAPAGADADLFYAITDGTALRFTLGSGTAFTLSTSVLYMVVLAVVMAVMLHHSRFGRWLFAIGGSEKAAELTGVPVVRMKIWAYVLCSLSAGFAGILMAGWLGSAPANLATGYELSIIAAAVIGGVNLMGGTGGPLAVIVGSALIEVIRNGLVLAGASSYWQTFFVGLLTVFAVLIDRFRGRHR
jgi:ribose transport system permease protein